MGVRNKWKRRVGRTIACFLSCLLLISCMGMPVLAAGGTGKTTSRAIAIVFDNSGSMYMQQNKAWCRATYAIEVFASMMNEGDTLQVYPMYDVTVGGVTYTSQNPFTISGGDDTSVIQTMYSPYAGDTPIETIGDAYNGVKKVNADERWLIVLTDGAVFYENGEELLGDATERRLSEVLTEYNKAVNVLYLGIDPVAVIPEVVSSGEYQYHSDKAADSRDTLTKLTEMCNMIFGRDVLAGAGSKLTFDVSMKKLILFVQGSGISGVTLTDANGRSVGDPSLEYSPRYGELGAGSVYKDGRPLSFSYDSSLSGYIAVYDTELDAGTYTLSYSGDVSSVNVYYEPDIDLTATLTDSFGSVMTAGSELYPGVYSINYGLVDKDGNTTTSKLLGDTKFVVTYSVNGEEKTARSNESGQVTVELAEGDVLDGKINVTYLSGYSITKDSNDFNWPFGGFQIVPRPAGSLELQVTGGQDTYALSRLEEGVYDLRLFYEGAPLSGELLASSEVAVAIDGGNAAYDMERTEEGYTVTLKHAGAAADTVCGPYTLRAAARFTNEFGVTSTSDPVEVPFTVEDDGFEFSMDVEGETYYVISQIPESDPIRVELSADGEPLTDEQLAAVVLKVDGDGLTCETQPVYGQSAFSVRIIGDEKAQKGRYELSFTAETQDQVGRLLTEEADLDVKLSPYPAWLPVLITVLVLLLILLLIWLYLSMKVLPKRITVNAAQTAFIVDGETVNGAAKCSYSGGGKRTGSLQVSTPAYSGDPLIKGGFNLSLAAVSPRRVKSSRRRVTVTGIGLTNSTAVQSLSVGTHSLVKMDEGDGVAWMFDSKQVPRANVPTSFEMGGKPTCTLVGETISGTTFTLTIQLQFK